MDTAPYLSELKTGVVVLNDSLCVEYLNSSAESILDTSSKSALKKPLSNLFYEEPDNVSTFKSCLENNKNFSKLDALLLLKGNKKVLCDYQLHPILKEGIDGALILEITNKEYSAEIKERRRRQTNQEITSEFIRGLAHEIKNPLSGIRGAAQLLSKKLPEESLNEYTNVVINQTDRLTRLVDNMLGPNRKPTFELLNIHIPIENVFTLVSRDPDMQTIMMNRDFDPSIPAISIDNYLLEQGILNLIKNAKESLLEDKTNNPEITVRTRILHQVYIGQNKEGTVCKISVEDNGPGIPEELKESIFFPMISGKQRGSGLGLSITQGIVSQHKGTIRFSSSSKKTEFLILIPIHQYRSTKNYLKTENG